MKSPGKTNEKLCSKENQEPLSGQFDKEDQELLDSLKEPSKKGPSIPVLATEKIK